MSLTVVNFLLIAVILIFSSAIKCFVDCNKITDFFFRRSRCDSCHKQLNFLDLIPVVSFILNKGRCRYCYKKIPIDVFLYELGGLFFSLLFFIFQDRFIFFSFLDLVIVVILYFLALEDIRSYEVNSRLFFILFVLVLYKGFIFGFDFLSFIFMVILGHILYFLARGGIGYGDIKVFSLLSLILNIYESVYLLIYTFLYAGLVALLLLIMKKVTKKSKLALLPYVVLAYITILIIREIMLW